MSTSAAVGALIETWRAKAAVNHAPQNVAADLKVGAACWAECRRECADELEAALHDWLPKLAEWEGITDRLQDAQIVGLTVVLQVETLLSEQAALAKAYKQSLDREAELRAAARTAGGWEPIESIPAKQGDVIVGGYYYHKCWMWNRFEFDDDGGWFCRDGGKATHAFVLPSSPTETK